MVLPHRSPVLTAKILATIDVLSNGRLIVGCGVGWMREEFEAIDAPPYEERGAVSNEYLAAFKELWTSDNPSFDGKYCSFSDITFAPKPVQQPHPPLWIGGESPPALRRAAQLGDAWYPIGSNPTFPVGTFDQLADYMGRVRTNAENAGRDPATLDFAYSVNWYSDEGAQDADGERRLLTGDAAQVADDINRLEGMGINHLMLNFPGDTADDTLAGMDRFVQQCQAALGLSERCADMAFTFTIEAEQEDDDRWIAEIVEIPGARAFGSTEDEAVANLQALALLVSAAILPIDTLTN